MIAGMLFGAPLVAQGDSPLLAVNAMGSGEPCDDVADAIEECLLETMRLCEQFDEALKQVASLTRQLASMAQQVEQARLLVWAARCLPPQPWPDKWPTEWWTAGQ